LKRRIPKARLGLPDSGMNKLEQRYAQEVLTPRLLAGELAWFEYEPLRLAIAPNTTYTPDFCALRVDGGFECHEVKQMWVGKDGSERVGYKEDARVKVKLAAQAFPFFEFIVAAYRAKNRKHRLLPQWTYDYLRASVDGASALATASP